MAANISVSQLGDGAFLYKQAAKMDGSLEEVQHKHTVLTKAKTG